LSASGAPLNPTTTFHFTDPYGGDDLVFVGGKKWTDDPRTWEWTTSKASSKTDINNVLLHIATDTNGHIWVVIAADRLSTSGDSYIDFEFLQNSLSRSNNGSFASSGPNGGRTTNDIFIESRLHWRRFDSRFLCMALASRGSGYAYNDVTASLPVRASVCRPKPKHVQAPYRAFGEMTYSPMHL
jgi:hypothetical protein